MRFGVLGPLAVWTTDGQPVRIPEAKVRALLADLLLAAGRPVSADRLIHDLWGDELPGSPANTLQTKVSQLRRVLERAETGGRELVTYQPAGYALRVDADAVDEARFQALTAQARASDDQRRRAGLLVEALGLWRGPALTDFADQEFARAAIARLEEQRLAAIEEQTEVRLALGEHGQLVAELADLVDAHPLRERLRAAHLQALYRSGRQSEALASYADLRQRLADELGLDPAPELAALHQAILNQDPSLEAEPVLAPQIRTNLPTPLTELVGREGAVSEVRKLLESGRLVTLTGSGGVGKTRLAIETATRLADTFPDGAWLIELAALRHNSVVSAAESVIAVLGIREGKAQLAELLRDKRLLLVLDNCEHVIEQVAELAGPLLAAVPGLRILATSQEPLGVAGETLWHVPPLELPRPGHSFGDRTAAVRLFVERATASAPGFVFDESNAEAVSEICRRLDGVPLALELAATRVRALGVHELVARLDDRFGLLASGHRGAPVRQRTLRAMIDWSWELLTASEQTVLSRLAVHAEGCTLRAAEAVCADDGLDVLDLLARLVDRSLVVVTQSCDGPRYRLLESVAVYCVERLRESGQLGAVLHRHASYYADFAEQAASHLRGHDQREWLKRLDLETANVRSALESAVRRGDRTLALRLANATAWYLYLRGRLGEACRSLAAALAVDGEAPGAACAAAIAWQAGIELLHGNDPAPVARSEAALKHYDAVEDDPRGRAMARWFHGFALFFATERNLGDKLIDAALVEFDAIGDRWGVAAVRGVRAHQALVRGDLVLARAEGELSAELFDQLGDRWGHTINPLATLATIAGDYERAERLFREGLRMAEDLGLWPDVAYKLAGLGRIALLGRDYDQARALHERARLLAVEHGFKPAELFAEIGLALGARRSGELDMAERHLRNVLEWYERVGIEQGNTLLLVEQGFIAEQRGDAEAALALHLDAFAVARDVVGDVRAAALAMEGLAGACALAGHPGQAALLLGAAASARQSVGAPLPSAERVDVDRITAVAKLALGEEGFTAEFGRGQGMSPDQARSALIWLL